MTQPTSPTRTGQETLHELLARVEGAKGGDRALDVAILDATNPHRARGGPYSNWIAAASAFDWNTRLTDSVDAALAHCVRVLPDYHILVSSAGAPPNARYPDCQWRAALKGDYDFVSGRPMYSNTGANCASPALGILAAMLKALIARPSLHTEPAVLTPKASEDEVST